jgi:phospholipase/carboxylesterase
MLLRGIQILTALCVCAAFAETPDAQSLSTDPPEATRPLGVGSNILRIEEGRAATLYVPRTYKEGVAAPLLVWLHGAGGSQLSTSVATLADEFGYLVLAPISQEWTWDSILGAWGPDADFILATMRYTFGHATVDRSRLWIGGFSDGGSYALSLGITAGDVFGRILAMSAGVMQPRAAEGKPRIFMSHGIADRTMPIDDTSRKFAPRLKGLGYDVMYREVPGGHTLPPDLLREAFEWLNR